MIEYRLRPIGQVRLSCSRITPICDAEMFAQHRFASGAAGTISNAYLCLEAFVPRGAMFDYGLLGLQFRPEARGEVLVEVPYRKSLGDLWRGSLVGDSDEVYLGLSEEYVAPLSDAIIASGAGQFPSGTIRVQEAACGAVSSNSRFFALIANSLLTTISRGLNLRAAEIPELLSSALVMGKTIS